MSLDVAIKGAGTVSREPALPAYPWRSTVTLAAVPDAGSLFQGWSGASTSTSRSIQLDLRTDTQLTAHCSCDWTLTVLPVEGVSVDPAQRAFADGASVTLTATVAPGY